MNIVRDDATEGVAVLRCDGRLNMVAAPALRSAIEHAVDGGAPRVVVDLAGAGFVDSSGLGALIAGLKKARQAGGDLRIVIRIAALGNDHFRHQRPDLLERETARPAQHWGVNREINNGRFETDFSRSAV